MQGSKKDSYCIITYCGKNYKKCLDLTLQTWKSDKILVFSDTKEFGTQLFQNETSDFNESCRRKIFTIKYCLTNNIHENIVYLDSDILMTDFIGEIFSNNFDICVTRMVHRSDTGGEKDINAGVSFWRPNQKTIQFCEQWLELEKQFQKTERFPEQHAFSHLCYKQYDSLCEVRVTNISERIYNFEHDEENKFFEWLTVYKPKIIHLKARRWEKKEIMKKLEKMLNLNFEIP
jgi:hypothetical protein